MLSSPAYRQVLGTQGRVVRANGVLPHEDGGGERAKLIVTMMIPSAGSTQRLCIG